MVRVISVIILLFAFLPHPIHAQQADFSTIDNTIKELYAVISGPAGERDWDRFHDIFHENASMGAITYNREGELIYMHMTPDSYVKSNGPFFMEQGFWEEELGRVEQVFGELAHVYSAYQFRLNSKDAPVSRRGINSIQLVFEQDRWWVISLQWNAEREGLKLPAHLDLKQN